MNKVKFTVRGEEWEVNAPVVHLPITKVNGNPMREVTKGELLIFARDGRPCVKIGGETFRVKFENE